MISPLLTGENQRRGVLREFDRAPWSHFEQHFYF